MFLSLSLAASKLMCLWVKLWILSLCHTHILPCLISSSSGQTWNRCTYFIKLPTQTLLTLVFFLPLRKAERIWWNQTEHPLPDTMWWRSVRWRMLVCFCWSTGRVRNLYVCYFCPSTLQCHPACPLPVITLPGGTELMMSSFWAISQLDLLTSELVQDTH